MKRIAILILLSAVSVYSQTYYLNVWSKGKLTSIPITEIKKIVFTGLTGTDDIAKEQKIIKTFDLFQNYPNPFNPSTIIEYQINNAGPVQIQVFNINGELIRTLTNTNQPAGKYSVTWDGKDNKNSNAASGIYIYRVVSGNSVLSKKMLLLK